MERDAPETLRGAIESGRIGACLKNQALYLALAVAVLGVAGIYLFIAAPKDDTEVDVQAVPHQAQILWDKGDEASAIALFGKVADQTPEAEDMMGVMYSAAKGPSHDDKAAVAWWQKAADRGYAAAALSLARAYETGKGVAADPAAAYRWAALAITQSKTSEIENNAADIAARLRPVLTPEQVEESDDWARNWKPAPP